MIPSIACRIENALPVPLSHIPVLSFDTFRKQVIASVDEGARLCSLFGMDRRASDKAPPAVRLFAILAHDAGKVLGAFSADVGETFSSLTPACPQAHMFERELAERWGVHPEGHPRLRPVRSQRDLPRGSGFFRVEGAGIHEVAVGPVHAGVIEPGHFRFQCHGEKVFHLEISLGYQHRGIERALLGGPHPLTLPQIETAAGDTTVGHTLAYCQAIEGLQGIKVPRRAKAIRAVGLELERMANHTGDLGALSGDVGYLPTAAYCGRIRGDFLNMSALICGSRLGRGLVKPGGVGFDIDAPKRLDKLMSSLSAARRDTRVAIELLWDTASVMSRFENTGTVSRRAARELGLVGPAARASGIDIDIRHDFPLGQYRVDKILMPEHGKNIGDVLARAEVRWAEIQHSFLFLKNVVPELPQGEIMAPEEARTPPLQEEALVVSLVEGWRGEICHTVITDPRGRFAMYKIVDPSFHNWTGLEMALRNQEISDFPLCNKSFNLSYCGFDL